VSVLLTINAVKNRQPIFPPPKANFKFQISNEKLRMRRLADGIFHFEFEIRNFSFRVSGGLP